MGNQKVREKKKPTFFLAVLPILAMILLLGVGYAVMGLKSRGTDAGFGGSGGSHCYRVGIYMG